MAGTVVSMELLFTTPCRIKSFDLSSDLCSCKSLLGKKDRANHPHTAFFDHSPCQNPERFHLCFIMFFPKTTWSVVQMRSWRVGTPQSFLHPPSPLVHRSPGRHTHVPVRPADATSLIEGASG